ncbi:MAG: hypothetical protein M0R70_14295 [Nitrospirae bacterium]|nr:hypothetical protein [Nitrospirota bacterium]
MKKIKRSEASDSSAIKVSKMIEQFAADYISMGETNEERQNYLNSACTAWNIAVLPEHARESALRHLAEEYERENPGIDDTDAYLQNMRTLIKEKVRMFPAANAVIVNAFLEQIDDKKVRISVVSTAQDK